VLQEYLASRPLIDASRSTSRTAADLWPAATWWERTGWEVVAEIAAEGCAGGEAAFWRMIGWLAEAQPEVACEGWGRVGAPALPSEFRDHLARHWMPRLTDVTAERDPAARAAIGRALGRFGLDHRPGVGLRKDRLPDIDWVHIPGDRPFVYQADMHRFALPAFEIARYPVTNRPVPGLR